MISKTLFINYSRCNRYCALEELYRKKDKAIVTLDDLMLLENNYKKDEILSFMYDENDEDIITPVNGQLEAMMPYYRKVEMLSARAITEKFQNKVLFDMDTFKQKRFSCYVEDYKFYCFLDAFQENKDGSFNIFESKATTSKKFLDLGYKEDGEFVPLFLESPEGILMLREELGMDQNINTKKYQEQRLRLFDRFSSCGKYVYDMAFQRYVIEKQLEEENSLDKLKNSRFFLAVLNSEYVFDGKYENGEAVYTNDIIKFIDLTTVSKEYFEKIDNDAKLVVYRLDNMSLNECELGKFCERKRITQCKYHKICYEKFPKLNSIFTYLNAHTGFNKMSLDELINEHYYSMDDIPIEWLTRKNNQIQRYVVDNKTPYIDKEKIIAGIKAIRYPIYHLDFESLPCPLPRFRGEKPYSQSLFQFSLHVENIEGLKDREENHYEYLAKNHDDIREEMMKYLIECIKKDNGSVLVYNESFEKTRLKEMAEIFPDLKEDLLDIRDRCFDLLHIVKTNKKLFESLGFDKERSGWINYYHEKLNGSYSIKKVLPVFSNLSYKDLVIQNGTEALVTYAKYKDINPGEFNTVYQNLLNYCKQDTWAMVVVLEALRKLVDFKKDL